MIVYRFKEHEKNTIDNLYHFVLLKEIYGPKSPRYVLVEIEIRRHDKDIFRKLKMCQDFYSQYLCHDIYWLDAHWLSASIDMVEHVFLSFETFKDEQEAQKWINSVYEPWIRFQVEPSWREWTIEEIDITYPIGY